MLHATVFATGPALFRSLSHHHRLFGIISPIVKPVFLGAPSSILLSLSSSDEDSLLDDSGGFAFPVPLTGALRFLPLLSELSEISEPEALDAEDALAFRFLAVDVPFAMGDLLLLSEVTEADSELEK